MASKGLQSNLDVDYVLVYRFADLDKSQAEVGLEELVGALSRVGLYTAVRNGENHSVLVFVRIADQKRLLAATYRSRTKDWLYGLRAAAPDKETLESLNNEPLTEAERLRIVYLLITNPPDEGGAGINPKHGQWQHVETLFPLHDHEFNKNWVKKWSGEYRLKPEDFDKIRDKFGEKVAFYFAFIQSYFMWLVMPAIFGTSAYFMLGQFSPFYAIFSCLWCVTFVEYWKRQETDLAIRWNVKGVSNIETKKINFKYERVVKDPITGETLKTFPAAKRLARQLLQIPFALLAASMLGTLIAGCFGIEIFISEVYDGPLKSVLVFLPTGILTAMVPTLTGILTTIATKLNDFENYETNAAYDAALTAKIFVLNFIVSYLPIFLTAFVYVPFGCLIVPYLDIFNLTVKPFATHEKQMQTPQAGFVINKDRLRKQVIYFTVTAQIVNFGMEAILPVLKRKGFIKYNEMKSERAAKRGGVVQSVNAEDPPEEAEFLARVRNEASLDVYDVTTDLREMVVQFGYLSLFSVIWPFAGLSFLINNFIEVRSDAIKICVQDQRPIPYRADTIGPWLDSLGFLAWLGSLTSAALVYTFANGGPEGTPDGIKGWALLLAMFASEHIYIVTRLAVRTAIRKLESPEVHAKRAEEYLVRKRYLEGTIGLEMEGVSEPITSAGLSEGLEGITRKSLEDDARKENLTGGESPEAKFWAHQRGPGEAIAVGKQLIGKAGVVEEKKTK